jgi:hypothetical protein
VTAVELLLDSELLRNPYGFRMPASNEEVAQRYVWQAWILPDPNQPGDPKISLELHHMERSSLGLDGLDKAFTDLLTEGKADYGSPVGMKSLIDASTSELRPHIPETYSLQPLFRDVDIDKTDKMEQRVYRVEQGRHRSPNRILLRWSDIQTALNQEGLHVTHFKGNVEEARWYQALSREDGKALVVARLPDAKNEKQHGTSPDEMYVKRRQYLDEGGAVVRLAAQLVQKLCEVVPLMMEDVDHFAPAYYTRPKSKPRDPFAKAESVFDELLKELRFAREAKTFGQAELDAMLVESGGELLEELRRAMLDDD